ncbi:hypothetical protein NLU13_1889 [Sarocladium strictum]|uniref:Uncharacterized protein n=1 Tax=Sarocladium strictum TaxID=5046 RepID=A0AA39GTS0_SARSR|nr:hypothetical protein NLU13_1889 [Sarocladium strictum]
MSSLSWDSVEPRADEFWRRHWEDSAKVVASQGFNFYGNTSSAFINELKFAAAKSIRTSFIVLAAFNVLAAVAVICGVLYDSVVAAKRDDPKFRFRPWSLWIIGPAEVFPFVVSLGIFVQGIIFAVVQSKGMQSLMILGCEPISQMTLSAFFIVPFIQLVFGMETSIRAFCKQPFQSRPIWLVPSLIAGVIVSLLVMFGLTNLALPPNFCFASLIWFIERWGVQCFGLLVGICGALIIGGVATFLRLTHSSRIDPTERLAASRMVYYMFAALLSNGLMTPFFYCISFSHPMAADLYPAQLAMVATVVANLTGIVTGALYLFLRSSRFSSIGAHGYDDMEKHRRNKLGIQIRRSSNSGYSNQMQQPLSPSWLFTNSNNNYEGVQREKHDEERVESPRQASVANPREPWTPNQPQAAYMLQDNSPGQVDGLRLNAPRPVLSTTQQALLSPATAAALLPPPPGILGGGNHRRDSSLASHATVQIGLRLSSVDDVPNRVPAQPDLPGKIHELGCPDQLGSISSRSTGQASSRGNPRRASSVYTTATTAAAAFVATPAPDLPPADDGIRLSPTVYTPDTQVRPLQLKVSSPKSSSANSDSERLSRPWPLSREAPSDLNNPNKSTGWI